MKTKYLSFTLVLAVAAATLAATVPHPRVAAATPNETTATPNEAAATPNETAAPAASTSPPAAAPAAGTTVGSATTLGTVTTVPTGTISGTVSLEPPPPPRRSANRGYATASAASHEVQRLPAVVYLRGAIAGASGESGAELVMAQRDTAFVPSGMAVTVGSTVSFPNRDPFFHNVFSYSSAKRFDLGRYPEGESKEVVFDQPGVVELLCEVHDFMRGAIVVTENPFHAVVAEDGSFSIGGVPAGEHTLVAWHADHDEVERTVTVTDGGVARVEVELRR